MFDNGKPIYHLLNHPIKWVRITGVVVAIDEFAERRILTVDDSSGSCLECVCAAPPTTSSSVPDSLDQFRVQITHSKGAADGKRTAVSVQRDTSNGVSTDNQPSTQNPLIPWQDVDIGSVLKIKGQLTKFRDMMQVDVIKIDIIACTEGEVKCWEEGLAFRKDVLSKPWVVSAEEGRRCEEKAARYEKERKRERSGRGKEQERSKGLNGRLEDRRRGTETEEERRRRHEVKKWKKGKEKDAEGLDPANKHNYPSIAVRRRVAGKYETLGT
jgi:hypothetical protein